MPFSREKLPPANASGLAYVWQQPWLVCTWSAHDPSRQSGSLPSPSFQYSYTVTTSAATAGELFLIEGGVNARSSSNVYVFSTRDYSITLLQTRGDVPSPRTGVCAALISNTLLVCGGETNKKSSLNRDSDSLYFLNVGTSGL